MKDLPGSRVVTVLAASVMIGIGLGLVILYGLGLAESSYADHLALGSMFSQNGPQVGKKAPDFSLTSLSGDTVQLSELTGKPVVINFWATWCAPCVAEMPIIQNYYDDSGQAFRVLAVNANEPQEKVQNFVNELGLTFDILLDPGGKVQDLYQLRGYPSTYLVDEKGIIIAQHIGVLSEGQFEKYFLQVGESR